MCPRPPRPANLSAPGSQAVTAALAKVAKGVTAGDLGGGRPVDQRDLVVAVEGQSAGAAGHLAAIAVGVQRGTGGGGAVNVTFHSEKNWARVNALWVGDSIWMTPLALWMCSGLIAPPRPSIPMPAGTATALPLTNTPR